MEEYKSLQWKTTKSMEDYKKFGDHEEFGRLQSQKVHKSQEARKSPEVRKSREVRKSQRRLTCLKKPESQESGRLADYKSQEAEE